MTRLISPHTPTGSLRRLSDACIREPWMRQAACRDSVDPGLFFLPDRDNNAGNSCTARRARDEREAAAQAVCAVCPVTAACGRYALAEDTRQRYGVWGGMTEDERAALTESAVRVPGPAVGREEGIAHGTSQGYQQHRYRQVPPCQLCRDAEAAKGKEKRRRQAA